MPRAVRDALLDCLVRGYVIRLHATTDLEKALEWAKEYLQSMEKEKRYLQETW